MTAPAPWYTVAEVAEALRTSPSRVLGHIHRGEIAAVNIAEKRVGGRPRWRIPADALERFAERRANTKQTQQCTTRRQSRPRGEVRYV